MGDCVARSRAGNLTHLKALIAAVVLFLAMLFRLSFKRFPNGGFAMDATPFVVAIVDDDAAVREFAPVPAGDGRSCGRDLRVGGAVS